MSQIPACPQCGLENTYPDGDHFVCADCGQEWSQIEPGEPDAGEAGLKVRDANGTVLQDGDTVVLVKDLKLRGGGGSLKVGTKVKNVRPDPGVVIVRMRLPTSMHSLERVLAHMNSESLRHRSTRRRRQ